MIVQRRALQIRNQLGMALGAFSFLLWSGGALAVDGVLEINQSCVAGGCFPGDTAGYPVQITNPGSYRLTGSLTLPDADTVGIRVLSDDVSIDLNGFAILGPTSCSGDPSEDARSCTSEPTDPENPGFGIQGIDLAPPNVAQDRVSVRNGSISGTGGVGLYLGNQARISDLQVSNTTAIGIATFSYSVVRDSTVTQSGGIEAGAGSIVEGCTAAENRGNGINVGDASTVRGSTARDNATLGISVGNGATVTQSSAVSNGSNGINGNGVNSITHNSSYFNGGTGITCPNSCVAIGNAVRTNAGLGFTGSEGSGLANNSFHQNNSGGDQISGIEMGENVCGLDLTCP
jgi:hypothetical protein